MKKFLKLCREIGAKRILEEEQVLSDKDGILSSERASKILSMPGKETLPLALIILKNKAKEHRTKGLKFLLRANLGMKELFPLTLFEDPEFIPSQFLVMLCEAGIEGRPAGKVTSYAGTLIRTYINQSSGDPDKLKKRIWAVRMLKEFPSPETEFFLKELLKGSGFLGMKKEPPEIRTAAKETLKETYTKWKQIKWKR